MKTFNKQVGFISYPMFFMIILLGFVLLCAFKILPSMLDNRFVISALIAAGENEPPLNKLSKPEIRNILSKAMTVNNVRGEPLKAIEIDRHKDKTYININYEVRNNLFSNIDVVMSFKNQLDSSRVDLCCKPQNE